MLDEFPRLLPVLGKKLAERMRFYQPLKMLHSLRGVGVKYFICITWNTVIRKITVYVSPLVILRSLLLEYHLPHLMLFLLNWHLRALATISNREVSCYMQNTESYIQSHNIEGKGCVIAGPWSVGKSAQPIPPILRDLRYVVFGSAAYCKSTKKSLNALTLDFRSPQMKWMLEIPFGTEQKFQTHFLLSNLHLFCNCRGPDDDVASLLAISRPSRPSSPQARALNISFSPLHWWRKPCTTTTTVS